VDYHPRILALAAAPLVAQTYVLPGNADRPAPGERVDIFSRDGEHLGCYGGLASSCSPFNPDSIENRFGKGNEFTPDSLRNEFGKYGSRFSQESWTNPFATEPPAVLQLDESRYDAGYKGDLTENDYNLHSLRYWDRDLDDSIKLELTEPTLLDDWD
jgi:hypothetical protein